MLKKMIVLGAGHGIGRSMVLQSLKENYEVYAIDQDRNALLSLQSEADSKGHSVHITEVQYLDLEKFNHVLVDLIKKAGRFDVWVNCVSQRKSNDFAKTSEAEFFQSLCLNLNTVITATRIALLNMEKHGHGQIVNLASIAGHIPAPFMTAYATAKHAIVGFTKSLQAELEIKQSPVRLMLVSPGFVLGVSDEKGADLPNWLAPIMANSDTVAEDILSGMASNKSEIVSTWNGKALMTLYKVAPKLTLKNSKLLLTKNLKDILLGHYKSF